RRTLAGPEVLDIGDGGEAAGGDHRDIHGIGDGAEHLDIEAHQGAVAVDVGDDESADASVLETARNGEGVKARVFQPALHGDLALAHVDADRDLLRPLTRGGLHEIRVAHGGGDR